MNKAKLFLLVSLGLLGGLIPLANADESDQKTTVTFSGPVELPGQVLQAGTYVFKLADSQSPEDVVQVYSADEKHLFGTVRYLPFDSGTARGTRRFGGRHVRGKDARHAGGSEGVVLSRQRHRP